MTERWKPPFAWLVLLTTSASLAACSPTSGPSIGAAEKPGAKGIVSPSPLPAIAQANAGKERAAVRRVAAAADSEVARYSATGKASFYGDRFHGRRTANGETFDMAALTAAHPSLPLPSYARVTNLANDRSVIVRVNDRGPYAHGRLIDVSERVASLLGFHNSGTADVRVQYVEGAPLRRDDSAFLLASYQGPGDPAASGVFASLKSRFVPPRGVAPAPPVVLAAAETKRRALTDEGPAAAALLPASAAARPAGPAGSAVAAFAEPVPARAGISDDVVTALTTGYGPDQRIFMAFDSAATADE